MEIFEPVLQSMNFRLAYADCDPAGIVYYASYYPWFERTYSEWKISDASAAADETGAWGARHISRASACEYLVVGKLFDPLRCEMRFGGMGKTSFTMVFDVVHREREELIARGHMVLVFIDDDRRPTPIPERFQDALKILGVAL
jgi:acyl-CoA thioester hydrolase